MYQLKIIKTILEKIYDGIIDFYDSIQIYYSYVTTT
jgi:hypothetical protein